VKKNETVKELDDEIFSRLTGVKKTTFNKTVKILRNTNKKKKHSYVYEKVRAKKSKNSYRYQFRKIIF
jgi:uncharacterized Fe-S cluster-containing radical SAM superfamily protein